MYPTPSCRFPSPTFSIHSIYLQGLSEMEYQALKPQQAGLQIVITYQIASFIRPDSTFC